MTQVMLARTDQLKAEDLKRCQAAFHGEPSP